MIQVLIPRNKQLESFLMQAIHIPLLKLVPKIASVSQPRLAFHYMSRYMVISIASIF